MSPFVKHAVVAVSAASLAALLVLACGTTNDSTFDTDGGSSGGEFDTDGAFGNLKPDGGDLYANDPPPKWCGPANQPAPPQPGGTQDCPDDKNKPGCGCDVLGEQKPCWTGLRANRGLGQCKDGVATCKQVSENVRAWSECAGEVLPNPSAARGPQACKCFTEGQWKLANLSPCFLEVCTALEQDPNDPTRQRCVPNTVSYRSATSSTLNGNSIECPKPTNPQPAPPGTWTANTLKVDCAGEFELCYELKAGAYVALPGAADPNDCSLAKVCTKGFYEKEDVEQPFPDLPTFALGGAPGSAQDTCIQKWNAGGGYGEMTVKGLSVRCDDISDANKPFVFNRVKYCPPKCRGGANTTDPECKDCLTGGSGTFN